MPVSIKKQNGIATILVVIIIGMLLTTAMLAVVANNRSTQEKQVATHAIVHSQAGLWSGVDLFKKYILDLNTTEARAELEGQTITLSYTDGGGVYTIDNIVYEAEDVAASKNAFINAEIKFYEASAKSTSAVEVYYEVAFIPCDLNCSRTTGDMDFYGDLTINSAMTFKGNSPVINVDGDVTFRGSSSFTDGINLKSTGTIDLMTYSDASYKFESIYTNEAFTANEGEVTTLTSLKDITITGGFKMLGLAKSNLSITSESTSPTGWLEARGDIQLNRGSMLSAKSNTKVGVVKDVSIVEIESQDVVTVGQQITNLESIKAYGVVTCGGDEWLDWTHTIKVNTKPTNVVSPIDGVLSVNNCKKKENESTPAFIDESLVITTVEMSDRVVMDKPHVNVWDLKPFANYAFTFNTGDYEKDIDGNFVLDNNDEKVEITNDDNRMRVAVKNIKNREDGFYYVRSDVDFGQVFCKVLVAGDCLDKNTNKIKFCSGVTTTSSCINRYYHSSTAGVDRKWSLSGNNIAPGIYFFEGDLVDNTKVSITTKLVTGDYEAGSNFKKAYSPNYAGFKAMCRNNYTGTVLDSNKGDQVGRFKWIRPTNLCSDAIGDYTPAVLGNVVLGAGGTDYRAAVPVYEGGNLNFLAATQGDLYGTLIAGDNVAVGVNLNIHGAIVALNDNENTNAANSIASGQLTFEDSALAPDSYNSNALPASNCEEGLDGRLVYYIDGVVVTKVVDENGDVVYKNEDLEIVPGIGQVNCQVYDGTSVGEFVTVSWARFL